MIQASSILPRLKEDGYHVIFNTTPAGEEILRHDPNIDEFYLQDTDQVPNQDLGPYWETLRRKYTKFINLSETVEGTMLAIPGRTVHFWTKEARHRACNTNYLELTHDVAGVGHKYEPRFYPTMEEREWAMRERTRIGGNLVVCFSMSGSSVHKTWPYLDQAIARLLATFPDCRVVLMGNQMSQMLEAGWENEPRVIRRAGVWEIRKSLTFACKQADLVIGPETGILNAVGMEDVAKVCFLSHSTKENLTKHWKNTMAIEPPASVPCYPCHQMHYNFDYCHQDEATGVAACQAAIPVDIAWVAILGILKKTGVLERAPPRMTANG
jgi:ADP-heptose:LPS heptosyltransferase